MINNQLTNYIREQISLGISKEIITKNLKSQGWTDEDLSEAFGVLAIQNQNIPPAPTPAPVATPMSAFQNTTIFEQQQNNLRVNDKTERATISAPSHKGRKIFLIIVILLVFILAGGGAYAYYTGMFLSFPKLTSDMMSNVRNTTSVTYDTTLSIDFSELKSATEGVNMMLSGASFPSKFSITTEGAYDFRDLENKKFSSLVSIDASTFSTKVDFRFIKNILYGQLVKAPTLSFSPVLSKYENKWYSHSFKTGEGETLDSFSNFVNPVAKVSGIDSNIAEKITKEQAEELYQIAQKASFIKMTKKLSPETINGQMTYHYLFDLDKAGISAYLSEIKDYVNNIGKNDSALSAYNPTSLSSELDKIQDFQGEIWIGRKDSLPYKIIIDFSIKPDENKDEKVKISMVNIFSDWNGTPSIVAPTESTSFEELISSVMQDSLGEARDKGKDAATKAILSNIRAQAEIFYQEKNNNSYLGFCASTELKNSRSEIESNDGTEFICKDSTTRYATSAKLVAETGYFCVDSSGFANNATKKLTETACVK